MHTSLASRVTQAYVGLFSVRQSNNGSRTVSFARFGNYDVRLVELLTIGSPIEASTNLGRTVEGAGYVQECVPEALALKRDVFRSLDAAADPQAILASSTSAIRMSEIASDLPGRRRCLVVHPGNPPYLLRVAEIVPAWFTSNETVTGCRRLLSSAGMRPILVRKEVEGFIFNRLQGAVLREAYCLVRDGVASVDDIDCIMREGLGLRWSIIGPFETADLNVRGGIVKHAKRMGEAYNRMGAERGQCDTWTEQLVAEVAAADARRCRSKNGRTASPGAIAC